MASLDLDDLPPKVARLIQGMVDGEALLLIQNGAVAGRLVVQTKPPPVDAEPGEPVPEPEPEPISSPVTAQKTREIFESFRAAIEDEF
jgi:hypothetical protein